MRITFLLPYAGLSGGIRVAAIYAEQLQRRGHRVVLISVPRREISLHSKVKSVLRWKGWPKRREEEPSYFEGRSLDHRVLSRYRPIEDSDVPNGDVVVATWWETAEWAQRLSPKKGAKIYFIQHYEALPGMPKDRVDATWQAPLQKIVISQWLLDLARDRFKDNLAAHIPNSVDTTQFWAPPRERQLRPTIGLLYSTVAWKGVDVSLEAIALVKKHLPDVRVLAFGSQRESPALNLPQGSSFSFQPPQAEIRNIYASCDVWLCGSRTEGFHLPPLEAMACRCPVVSTRVGGPVDIIRDGINGYLVNVDDAEALAERLLRVLTKSDEDWLKMSEAAHSTAHDYSWEDATVLFERALIAAIERKDSRDSIAKFETSGGVNA